MHTFSLSVIVFNTISIIPTIFSLIFFNKSLGIFSISCDIDLKEILSLIKVGVM